MSHHLQWKPETPFPICLPHSQSYFLKLKQNRYLIGQLQKFYWHVYVVRHNLTELTTKSSE